MQKLFKLRKALTILGLSVSVALTCSLAASAKSTDAPGLRSIAFEHYLSGDTEAALDYYQKAIDTAGRDYGAESSYIGQLYYEMGTLALDAKKFVRSESYLQKAVQHNPNSVMARVKFAELLQLRGKNDEALQQIHTALAKHSSSPEAREALVIWLQSNHKTARAIHESYNITVAAAGNVVAPPVSQTVLAKAESSKSDTKPEALIAAATPAATSAQTGAPAPAAKVPLKVFPWMMQQEKKPEPKKPEPEKKPEKKEEKKPVETRKPEKKAPKKEPKQQKPAKEKHAKQSKQQTEIAQEEMRASAAALRTTAKTLPKKKDVKSSDGSDPAESGQQEEAAAPPAKVRHVQTAAAQAPTMVFGVPAVKSSKRPQGMVPPPPPMVPVFGNPMGMFQQPPPAFHPAAAPKAAGKKSKATAPAVAKEPAPTPATSGEEPDPNFLLEWAGANAKKKGK